jgi:hypothetical protein
MTVSFASSVSYAMVEASELSSKNYGFLVSRPHCVKFGYYLTFLSLSAKLKTLLGL